MTSRENIKILNRRGLFSRLTACFVFMFVFQLSFSVTFQDYNNDSLFDHFVILGSFRVYNNAVQFKDELADLSFDPFILRSEELFYRICVDSFTRRTDAQRRVLQIRRTYPEYHDAWILIKDKVSAAYSPDDDRLPDRDPFCKADSLSVLYRVTDLSERYRIINLKAEWAAEYQQYEEAIEFYEQAVDLKPWNDHPKKRIDEIKSKLERDRINIILPETDFGQSSALIQILVLVTVFSILSMIVLLVIILLHRNLLENEAKLRQELKEKYQMLLMSYLFDEGHVAEIPAKIGKIAGDNFKRRILMEEMKDLIVNLSGDAAEKLRELYYKLSLDVDSRIKASSKKWHIRIKGFRELAFMNIKDANQEIIKCLHSHNSILRMEAQLALVRLNDRDRFSFLDHLQRPFTKWEQLNVHEMIISHDLEIPDFQRWLCSDNRTVVIFSLKMIKVFKQRNAWKTIVHLLENDDPEIRRTTIFVLGELRIKQSASSLKHHYKYEIYENLLEIVIALGKIADESVINFLVMVIDKEDDVQLQIEAAKALREMGDSGQKALEKLMQSDYKNYIIIIKHVLDKRI